MACHAAAAGYRTACVGQWHLGLGNGTIDWNGEIKPGPSRVGFNYSLLSRQPLTACLVCLWKMVV